MLPAAVWAWKRRHALQSLLAFAKTAPERAKMGRWSDVSLGFRVHAALVAEPALQGARIRVGSVSGNDGSVTLSASPNDPKLELARDVVCAVKGVRAVRVADEWPTPLATTTPTATTGSSATANDVNAPTPLRQPA